MLKIGPVLEERQGTRGLIAAQAVLAFRTFGYGLTSHIGNISQHLLTEILDYFSAFTSVGPSFFPVCSISSLPHTTLFLLIAVPCLFLSSLPSSASPPQAEPLPSAAHVPSFYAPTTKSNKYSCTVLFALFGVTFGGLHCIGWDFERPTILEKHFWRPSSLTITVILPTVVPINYVLEIFEPIKGFEQVLLVSDCILLFVYLPTRLCLVAQAHCRLLSWPSSGQTTFLTYSGFHCILISSVMCQLSCHSQ